MSITMADAEDHGDEWDAHPEYIAWLMLVCDIDFSLFRFTTPPRLCFDADGADEG